jgi:2'-5' RNA ligase
MDHVIAPLGPNHVTAVERMVTDLAASLDLPVRTIAPSTPHITFASYTDLQPGRAAEALEPVALTTRPFTVRAHGYGVFAGDADTDLSLNVIVVRTRALDELHGRIHGALGSAGARVAGNTCPSVWTPHVTVLDRGLTPRRLGRAIELLAQHPHRTWTIDIASLAVTPRRDGRRFPATLALTGPVAKVRGSSSS